ncbi:MAG: potassium channel family protein [Rhodococcus sp.]|uniref:potassium channel family protein n=1 Tax=Rhodococcus TaxID=1827 RepID=UPI00169F1E8A|nr:MULTISPECIES: potassium channel family protein [Rhodococcus]NLV79664.1 potassium channel family protein [Rhodococcus sp. (in: high G+C Gram-positive bacteria)]
MPDRLRARFSRSDQLTERPDFALVGVLKVPQSIASPERAIVRRIGYALGALFLMVLIVYIDRDGYRDSRGDGMSLLDCVYYATVSLSTTGYGDITPVTPGARLVNVLLITPLRVFFLIVLVGTTLSALTESSRQTFRIQSWRRRVHDHTVVVGYGTKGRSAVDAMLGDGVPPSQIVVVDADPVVLETAAGQGLVTVQGSATKSDVLRLAGVQRAAAVIVATSRDDSAVLITLNVREISATAKLVVAIRESGNAHLLRRSGADSVVVSSETAGRLLGVATSAPHVVEVIEDILTPEMGFTLSERQVDDDEVGADPRHLRQIVLGIERRGSLYRVGSPEVATLVEGDTLLYLRLATDRSIED